MLTGVRIAAERERIKRAVETARRRIRQPQKGIPSMMSSTSKLAAALSIVTAVAAIALGLLAPVPADDGCPDDVVPRLARPGDGACASNQVAAVIAQAKTNAGSRREPNGGTPGAYNLIATSIPQAPTTSLTPNDRGYVRVQTKSGSTGCSINTELVACQTSADNWPIGPSGRHFHTASINANGDFNWVEADLGALEGRVTLDFRTYTAQGWTIVADSEATKFTNDRSGHGMSVSDESVTPF
ncbi:hypothetical protein ACKUT9_25785 [Mycobacterium seoulense]|uniref:hypothetical protein n=1 Tax=Mycobacterium seoulense TaxID=386911 RepID=UPI003CEF374F